MLKEEFVTVNVDDIKSYKPCVKKEYTLHACKAKAGMIIVNKLEQSEIVHQLGGRFCFMPDEVKFNSLLQALIEQKKCYVLKFNDFVLCGTQGELWVVSSSNLFAYYSYTFEKDTDFDCPESLLSDFDWFIVKSVPNSATVHACFVPVCQTGCVATAGGVKLYYNCPDLEHSNGDYVIAGDKDGNPDLSNRWVVNGKVFEDTYSFLNS